MRLLLLFTALVGAYCAQLSNVSLVSPISYSDENQKRRLRKYRSGGDAVIHSNYVRLTPDRQSKAGWIWSKSAIGSPTFSVIVDFRISGNKATLFGDGLGLWVTTSSERVAGELHGFTHNFYGLGVVVDTYRNSGNINHKDISLLWNDNSRSQEEVLFSMVGCDAPTIRYHDQRADFSVHNHSKIRLSFVDGAVEVDVDYAGKGNWIACARLNVPLTGERLTASHIGLLATTGHLADNHDVRSVTVLDGIDLSHPAHEATQLVDAEDARFDDLEHRLVGLVEGLQTAVSRLRAAEKDDFRRLDALESRLISTASDQLNERVASVEDRMRTLALADVESLIQQLEEKAKVRTAYRLDERIGSLQKTVEEVTASRLERIESMVDEHLRHLAESSGAGGWRIPMVAMGIILLLVMGWAWRWSRWAKRKYTL